MDENTRKLFEEWAKPFGYSLEKMSAMPTENPYSKSTAWIAYEAFCAGLKISLAGTTLSPTQTTY